MPPVGRPLGQCLPRPAVIAHRQLEAALRLGLEPEGQPGKILFFRAVQPDVPADQLEPHPLFEAVGPLPVLLPLRIRRPDRLAIPEVKLSTAAGHLVGADVLLLPQAPLGVVDQQPDGLGFAAAPHEMQVIPPVQRTAQS